MKNYDVYIRIQEIKNKYSFDELVLYCENIIL